MTNGGEKHIPIGLVILSYAACVMWGCHVGSQSFQHGRVLDPAERMLGIGVGKRTFCDVPKADPDRLDNDHDSTISPITTPDSLFFAGQGYSAHYRLGVLEKYPFGYGMEMRIHLEYPAQLARLHGLPYFECLANMGLRPVGSLTNNMFHSLGIGAGAGMWVDNSWIVEYALGLEKGFMGPYVNIRGVLTGTDLSDRDLSIHNRSLLQEHNQNGFVRIAGGMMLGLPKLPLLPSHVCPEFTFSKSFGATSAAWRGLGHVGFIWRGGH